MAFLVTLASQQSPQPGVEGDQWNSTAIFFKVLDPATAQQQPAGFVPVRDQPVCCGVREGSSFLCRKAEVSEGVFSLGHSDCTGHLDCLPLWFPPEL